MKLPFVIVIRYQTAPPLTVSSDPDGARNVLHGSAFTHWIGGLVDAFMETAADRNASLMSTVIQPHIYDAICRLVVHSNVVSASKPAPPPPPAYLEELPDEPSPRPSTSAPPSRGTGGGIANTTDHMPLDEEDTEGYHTTVSTVPGPGHFSHARTIRSPKGQQKTSQCRFQPAGRHAGR